jgi:hypothetical protein
MAVTWTSIAMAESGGRQEQHGGEDSFGLWQINVAPSRSDPNPSGFDCSELTQWASGSVASDDPTWTAIAPDWLLS